MQSREREVEVVPCRSVSGNLPYPWKWGPAAPRPRGRLHGGRIAAFSPPRRWWPLHPALRSRLWSVGSLPESRTGGRQRSALEARPWPAAVCPGQRRREGVEGGQAPPNDLLVLLLYTL
jgi:hypothetical protein